MATDPVRVAAKLAASLGVQRCEPEVSPPSGAVAAFRNISPVAEEWYLVDHPGLHLEGHLGGGWEVVSCGCSACAEGKARLQARKRSELGEGVGAQKAIAIT